MTDTTEATFLATIKEDECGWGDITLSFYGPGDDYLIQQSGKTVIVTPSQIKELIAALKEQDHG